MTTLLTVAGMLRRGGSRTERARERLMATGAALATWFLFGALNVLALHGTLDDRFGPISAPGTRGGTALALCLMVLPVAAFLYQSGRLAAADRERRLAALRLAGATPREVRLLGATEATRAAAVGTVAGGAAYLLIQWTARRTLLPAGSKTDVNVPPVACVAAVALVVAAGTVSGLLAGRHVVATPLGVTRRANRPKPRWYGLILVAVPLVVVMTGWVADLGRLPFLPPSAGGVLIMGGGAFLAAGLLMSATWLVWFGASVVARRARTAETLLAARGLQADPRPWGRSLSVVGLAAAIGSVEGWFEADIVHERGRIEPFWETSFILVNAALPIGMVVAAAALLVHRAEHLLEQGPVLATLHAGGVSERTLRRVMRRQAVIAATPVCGVGALLGLVGFAVPPTAVWMLWPAGRALLMAVLGVLAAVAAARGGRRLRRTLAPERLRTE